MNYKIKCFTTLWVLFILFSFLLVESTHLRPPPPQNNPIPITNFLMGWDQPLTSKTLQEKISGCKIDPECEKLAEAIVWEARSESLMGRYAVAAVIMERVRTNKWGWGGTVREVVHQRFQFEYLDNMHLQKPPNKKDWDEGFIIAFDTLNGKIAPVLEADHYHTVDIQPKWSKSPKLRYVATIGRHIFYTTKIESI